MATLVGLQYLDSMHGRTASLINSKLLYNKLPLYMIFQKQDHEV